MSIERGGIINNISPERWSFSIAKEFMLTRKQQGGERTTTPGIRNDHQFTPQEASKLLSDIKPKVRDLIERRKVLTEMHEDLERYNLLGFRTEEMAERAALLDALADKFAKGVAELQDLGVAVSDLDHGLFDFHAERFGEEVCLCWSYGEAEVSFWHKLDEPCRKRVPLRAQQLIPP